MHKTSNGWMFGVSDARHDACICLHSDVLAGAAGDADPDLHWSIRVSVPRPGRIRCKSLQISEHRRPPQRRRRRAEAPLHRGRSQRNSRHAGRSLGHTDCRHSSRDSRDHLRSRNRRARDEECHSTVHNACWPPAT